jgi:cytochrome P450
MPTETETPSQAAWSQDRLGSPLPPAAEPPYFDGSLDAWVFSRYVDIVAALRDPSLIPTSVTKRKPATEWNDEEHLKMRSETLAALPASQLRAWKEQLAHHARQLVSTLPQDRPVDLIGEYASPLCLALSIAITGIHRDDALIILGRAQTISAAAANPYDEALSKTAKTADAEIRRCFHAGPESLRHGGFVAITQTMPALLGNTWFALLEHPKVWESLHQHPQRVEQSIEELMRYAGFTRILARMATTDVVINDTPIRKDDRILLRLIAANRDPECFLNPNEIDLSRRGSTHLSFGAGVHSCVGAGLLRMIASTTTSALVSRFASARIARIITWRGGAVFCSPQTLWAHLRSSDTTSES